MLPLVSLCLTTHSPWLVLTPFFLASFTGTLLRVWVKGRLRAKGALQAVTLWEEQGPPDQGVSLIPHRLGRQIPD